MKERFLLYIDVLGFSDLVINKPEQVRRIFRIIDNLNCHRHGYFNSIVFSDTILVYNVDEALHDSDKQYCVMFLIEFAQDLLYRTIGKDIFFRAVLTYGEFEHTKGKNIEIFFGSALVNAYKKERNIPSIGLFISKYCNQYNVVFPSKPFDNDYSFVYLNQSIDSLKSECGRIPVERKLLEDMDYPWLLIRDVRMLKDISQLKENHPEINVRQKFILAWHYYQDRYKWLTDKLVSSNFDLNVISKGLPWKEYNRFLREDFRGFGANIPSIPLSDIVLLAREAGAEAAKKRCFQFFGVDHDNHTKFLPCGGATIILDVDSRSKIGRFLLNESPTIPRISVYRHRKKGIIFNIFDMHNSQAQAIEEVAADAALNILTKHLKVLGYIETYWN